MTALSLILSRQNRPSSILCRHHALTGMAGKCASCFCRVTHCMVCGCVICLSPSLSPSLSLCPPRPLTHTSRLSSLPPSLHPSFSYLNFPPASPGGLECTNLAFRAPTHGQHKTQTFRFSVQGLGFRLGSEFSKMCSPGRWLFLHKREKKREGGSEREHERAKEGERGESGKREEERGKREREREGEREGGRERQTGHQLLARRQDFKPAAIPLQHLGDPRQQDLRAEKFRP